MQYMLKVFETTEKEFVRYFRGTIEMYVKDVKNFRKKEQLMKKWYENRRGIVFKESLERMYKAVRFYNIAFPQLETRQIKRMWGSNLARSNKIILNKDLIIAPRFCNDYVGLH